MSLISKASIVSPRRTQAIEMADNSASGNSVTTVMQYNMIQNGDKVFPQDRL